MTALVAGWQGQVGDIVQLIHTRIEQSDRVARPFERPGKHGEILEMHVWDGDGGFHGRQSTTQRATVAVRRRRGQGAPPAGGASPSAQKRAQATTSCQSKHSAASAIAPTRASFAAAASTAP